MKMLVGLTAIFGVRLFLTHVTQAYLEGAEAVNQEILIIPPKEFHFSPGELIKFLKPINGLVENRDYSARTFRS